MARVAFRSLIFGLLTVGVALAQERPNFAGRWSPVEGVNPAVDFIVTQTTTLLTAKAGDEPGHGLEYRLDGAESRQSAGSVRSKTQWEGARLLVTNTFTTDAGTENVQKQVWSLDATDQLVIETIRERAGQTRVTKSIYKRR